LTNMVETDPLRTPGGLATINLDDASVEEAFVQTPAPQNISIPELPELVIAEGGKSTVILGGDAPQDAFIRQVAPNNVQMPEQEVVRASGGLATVTLGGDAPEEAFIRQVAPNNVQMPEQEVVKASGGLATITLGGDAPEEAFIRQVAPNNVQMPEQEVVKANGGMATISLGGDAPQEAWIRQAAPQNVQMPEQDVVIAEGGKATVVLGEEACDAGFVRMAAPQNTEIMSIKEDAVCSGVTSSELGDAPNAGFRHAAAWNRGTPPRHTKMFEKDASDEARTAGGAASLNLADCSFEEAFVVTPAPQNVPMSIPEPEILTERVAPGGTTKSSIVLGGDASDKAFIRQTAPQNVQMPEQEVIIATGGKSTIVLGGYATDVEKKTAVEEHDSENDPNAINCCATTELEIKKMPMTVLGENRAPPGGASVLILG